MAPMESMPLENPRWETYAQKRCEGLTQRQAMLAAYPNRKAWKPATVDNKAYLLERKGEVKARIAALKREAAEKSTITRAEVIAGMSKAFETSLSNLECRTDRGNLDGAAVNGVTYLGRTLLDQLPQDEEGAAQAGPPPFDVSAAISPAFCEVSRAIAAGANDVTLKGGRGSGKSSYAYVKGLDLFLANPDDMWVCLRQFANTLRRSCFANVLWAIRLRGMTVGSKGDDADFWATVSPMEVVYPRTGQQIVFTGLDDPEKLKSITFDDPAKKVGIVTFEEYSQFRDPADVRKAQLSLLRGDHGWVFKLFNPPPDEDHWANREAAEALEAGDPSRIVHHSTWRDVPREWTGARFAEKAERMYRENPEAAKNELDGETVELSGRVFPNVEDGEITDEDIAGFKAVFNGLDWGYESDPFVFLRCAYDRKQKTLYVFGELWAYHERNEVTAAKVLERLAERDGEGRPLRTDDGAPVVRRVPANQVRCDVAEKKSIADFRAFGVDAVGASKRVPVADGIRWLQNRRRIVIDRRRCPLAYQEFVRYRAETDAEGRFKGYPDKDNHAIDAARYAVFDVIADPEQT